MNGTTLSSPRFQAKQKIVASLLLNILDCNINSTSLAAHGLDKLSLLGKKSLWISGLRKCWWMELHPVGSQSLGQFHKGSVLGPALFNDWWPGQWDWVHPQSVYSEHQAGWECSSAAEGSGQDGSRDQGWLYWHSVRQSAVSCPWVSTASRSA